MAQGRGREIIVLAGEVITVGFREIETTVFDPASVFLSTH